MPAQPMVPDYRHFFNPILKSLKALGGSASIEELNSRAATEMKLSDEVLAVPHDKEHGGQSEVAYRMAWARYYLKTAGLIINSERAVWSLTPAGAKAGEIDAKALAKEVQAKKKRRAKKPDHEAEGVDEEDEDSEDSWKHTALEAMHSMKADAFERLCQRVLRENGFVEVKVTGRTNDKGIDGIGLLKMQQLLTFHVIFQCKRWRDPVGASTVRDFRGAMVGRTDKGLIMTTSYFTPEAVREATRDGAPAIDLVDGDQLVELLRRLKLGVTTELVERVSVDEEWFKSI